ncbi:unnamed protein product [Allacma fusca]|uniref:EXS domain-containing protein n=1 Tax=Allacma fusca TaxID=39272 RepID=A0A8J2LDI8_9HEXA|nr:unnamed protein product [Allacma fusca]
MDWGLGDRRAKNPFLRGDLLFPSYWYYYVAVIADFILRFVWAISLSLTEMGFVDSDIMLTITTPAEIFRRFMWNLFRLEHEQINNNNAQRLNRLQMIGSDTSIQATDEQRMKELLKMMDLEDGVTKHRASINLVASSSRLSVSASVKTIDRSKTELFTRVSSQHDNKTEGSEVSSNDNAGESFKMDFGLEEAVIVIATCVSAVLFRTRLQMVD